MRRQLSGRMNNPFTSLKYPNFRYFWIGMCVSTIGTWMQNIAQPWLAYSLTNSPLLLSLVGTLQFLPVMLFSLFAGVFIDRFPKKKVLMLTQFSFLMITMILTILVLSRQIQYWHILVLATLMGIVNTFDMPARQAIVIQLIEKESLMNAIALNSIAFNMARVIGPTIAGLLMGYVGVGFCFLFNSLSYGAVLISLFFIKPNVPEVIEKTKVERSVMVEIKEGLAYIYSKPQILRSLILIGIVGTFALNNNVLVPVFIKEVLQLPETYFGLTISIMGVGSLLGSFATASLSKDGPSRVVLNYFPFVIGSALCVAGMVNHYLPLGLALAITGFFFIIFSSTVNTSIQIDLDNQFRGRVMSVYALVFAGTTPIGSLFAGSIDNQFGGRAGFIACGAMTLLLIAAVSIYKHKDKSPRAQRES